MMQDYSTIQAKFWRKLISHVSRKLNMITSDYQESVQRYYNQDIFYTFMPCRGKISGPTKVGLVRVFLFLLFIFSTSEYSDVLLLSKVTKLYIVPLSVFLPSVLLILINILYLWLAVPGPLNDPTEDVLLQFSLGLYRGPETANHRQRMLIKMSSTLCFSSTHPKNEPYSSFKLM